MLDLNEGNKEDKRHFGILWIVVWDYVVILTHFHIQSCSKLICLDMIIVMPGHSSHTNIVSIGHTYT